MLSAQANRYKQNKEKRLATFFVKQNKNHYLTY